MPQSRTLFLGQTAQKYRMRKMAVLSKQLTRRLEQANRQPMRDIWPAAFNTTCANAGSRKDSRCGYAHRAGSLSSRLGANATMFLPRRTTPQCLNRDDLFTLCQRCGWNDGGIEITEPIVITENGCLDLSVAPTRVRFVIKE